MNIGPIPALSFSALSESEGVTAENLPQCEDSSWSSGGCTSSAAQRLPALCILLISVDSVGGATSAPSVEAKLGIVSAQGARLASGLSSVALLLRTTGAGGPLGVSALTSQELGSPPDIASICFLCSSIASRKDWFSANKSSTDTPTGRVPRLVASLNSGDIVAVVGNCAHSEEGCVKLVAGPMAANAPSTVSPAPRAPKVSPDTSSALPAEDASKPLISPDGPIGKGSGEKSGGCVMPWWSPL
mmetsp:Transcript_71797/g.199241  ORF Transcript_71797/g.199241 Transcript_71797/m.199241 type:complete len:244 (-) Transcript_71797:861-1592(-)